MEGIIKEKDLIKVCNDLIKSGLQIRVFGLKYEPYYENITITDEEANRSGFILTTSGIALDCKAVVSKMKVRTFTGFSRLFTKVEGRDEYRINLTDDHKWVRISHLDADSIAPGMLLINDYKNLGMILDVFHPKTDESSEDPYSICITTVNENLFENTWKIDTLKPESSETPYILDRVIKQL